MDAQKPTSEQKSLWMGMARLVSHLAREAGQGVEAAEGINLSQMTLMGQVEALGGSARMVDLANRLQVSKPAITKIVDALEIIVRSTGRVLCRRCVLPCYSGWLLRSTNVCRA